MNEYPLFVKNTLLGLIDEMSASPEPFVRNPEKDFTRNRKLPFDQIVKILLSIGGNSLGTEIIKYFKYDISAATSSAFIQQRDKILPEAFEFLFHKFTNAFDKLKTFDEYRLLVADGSDINIFHNPKDTDTYFQSKPDYKGFNQVYINAMYDLCNKLYVDSIIQPLRKKNEYLALTDMVDRSEISSNVIVVADRGYESYNVFAHIEEKRWNYVIRVKDICSNGILSGLKLPNKDEFDTEIHLNITRKQTNEVKNNPQMYKFLPSTSTFDYLNLKDNKLHPISFRVIRLKLSDDIYETLVTNLNSEEFPTQKIKDIYHLRWGIETSFSELKYAIGISNLHAKNVDNISQEIFA